MANSSHYPSPFGDTTLTKVFVGGLAWETQTEELRRYFQQFGEIVEAVIIRDKNTGKSKGYGFVTFRDPESARTACGNPNPIIGGRRANCNIASLGRRRSPSSFPPTEGRNPQTTAPAATYGGFRPPFQVIYPPYGYQSYTPNYAPYHQAIYNPQMYHHGYGASSPSSSSTSSSSSGFGFGVGYGSPYYYGYTSQAPRAAFSVPHQTRSFPGPSSYPYYPNYPQIHHGSLYAPMQQIATPTGSQASQHTPTETEAGVSDSNSPNTS